MYITPDIIQSMSIKVVTKFMSKQASLSEAVADEAKTADLNPDQIKRVIEASNSIAYLRQLEDAPDRTFEFPIAKYEEVISHLTSTPEPVQPVTPQDKVEMVEKQASVQTEGLSREYRQSVLNTEFFKAKGELEKLAYDMEIVKQNLEDLAYKVSKDPYGFEKLSMVSPTESLDKLSKLTGLTKKADYSPLFRDSDLITTKALVETLSQAQGLIEKKAYLEDFVKRAGFISSGFEVIKNVFKSPVASLGKGLGNLGGAAASGAMQAATFVPKKVYKGIAAGLSNRSAINNAVKKGVQGMTPNGVLRPVTSKADAIAGFDHDLKQYGRTHAETKWGFKNPGMLQRMKGETAVAVGTAAAFAPSMKHDTPVWDTLHPKTYQE